MNIFTFFNAPVTHLIIGLTLLIPLWLYTRTTLVFYPVDKTGKNLTGYRLRYRMTWMRTLGILAAAIFLTAVAFLPLIPVSVSNLTSATAVPVIASALILLVRLSELTNRVRDTTVAVCLSLPVGLLCTYTVTAVATVVVNHYGIMQV